MIVFSEGHRIVAALAKQWGAAEFARRVDTSASMIGHVAAGRKTPGRELREKMATWGVRPEAWTEAAASHPIDTRDLLADVRVPFVGAEASPPGPMRGRDALVAVLADFDERIGQAKLVGAPEGILVALLNGKAAAAEKLALIQGEHEMTLSQIVRTEVWNAVMCALIDVADRHPEAARALEDKLIELEDDADEESDDDATEPEEPS